MARVLALIYGSLCYVVCLVTLLYAICFVGNITPIVIGGTNLVPRTIDVAASTVASGVLGWILNLILLSAFALQHSVMARPAFKKVWTKVVPKAVERSTYVLLSSCVLILLFVYWVPMTDPIWTATGPLATVIRAVFFLGFGIVALSTFMINHFDLLGLRQVVDNMQNKIRERETFVTTGLYKLCRHPIMLGFIVAFWAAPAMTVGHMLFSVLTTTYIFVAIVFEEKDLTDQYGDTYREYKRATPKVFPFRRGQQPSEPVTNAVVKPPPHEAKEKETTSVG